MRLMKICLASAFFIPTGCSTSPVPPPEGLTWVTQARKSPSPPDFKVSISPTPERESQAGKKVCVKLDTSWHLYQVPLELQLRSDLVSLAKDQKTAIVYDCPKPTLHFHLVNFRTSIRRNNRP